MLRLMVFQKVVTQVKTGVKKFCNRFRKRNSLLFGTASLVTEPIQPVYINAFELSRGAR
jgi:hypothetical protein